MIIRIESQKNYITGVINSQSTKKITAIISQKQHFSSYELNFSKEHKLGTVYTRVINVGII